MQAAVRPLPVIFFLLLLAGCGSSSYSSTRGNGEPTGGTSSTGTGGNPAANPIGGVVSKPSGSNNSVLATPSVAGTVSVETGAKRTIGITFTSSDGRPTSGFGVSGTLGTLPAGWSGPASFSCASVGSGSGCVLYLTYAPMAQESGTLTVNYVFVDNSTMPSTGGSVSVAYEATAHNHVLAAASPGGEINSVSGGGTQSVNVNFTTDDGYAATNLTLTTDLSALPSGWSAGMTSFSCAIVSTGNGCQLPLSFAPAGGVRGALTLNYSYVDDSGATQTGDVNIPYSNASHNSVVASGAPSGQINAVQMSGGQATTITFVSDDGKPATNFYLTTALTALPAGWSSSANRLSCASVSSGNGCQLHLNYAPATLTSGTLILTYAYTDGAGAPEAGSLSLPYAATTNDNGVATASPTGQINAVVGTGAQPVSIAFTTDDGREATALQVGNDLTALPAGWSSAAGAFSCSGFSSGSGCQLILQYQPTAAGNGTLLLNYTYLNNAGVPKTGTVSIVYRATTIDNIVGTPSQTPVALTIGSSTTVNVDFTTDDGNPATALLVTAGLDTLPTDWSGAATFNCATVSTGTGCRLGLTYTPTVAAAATLSLTYSYYDNSGTAKTGSVSIPFSAAP